MMSLAGPIAAQVVEVIDGDTIRVRARIWLNQDVETLVRLVGVDTPELKARCPAERALALQARAFTESALTTAEGSLAHVALRDVRFDKFGGRVLARIATDADADLGQALVQAGFARPYAGATRASSSSVSAPRTACRSVSKPSPRCPLWVASFTALPETLSAIR